MFRAVVTSVRIVSGTWRERGSNAAGLVELMSSAALVASLMVVLCSMRGTQPIANMGEGAAPGLPGDAPRRMLGTAL